MKDDDGMLEKWFLGLSKYNEEKRPKGLLVFQRIVHTYMLIGIEDTSIITFSIPIYSYYNCPIQI